MALRGEQSSPRFKLYIEDLVDDFAENFVPCVQANATYENKYLLEYLHGPSGHRKTPR